MSKFNKKFLFAALKGFFWSNVAVFFAAFLFVSLENFPLLSMIRVERGFAFGVMALVFCAPLFIGFGFPVHAILFYFEISSIYVYLFFGFLGGLLIIALFIGGNPTSTLINQVIMFGAFGSLYSFVFWAFAVKKQSPIQR